MPCNTRPIVSSTAPQLPIDSYDGTSPIPVVATPINTNVVTSSAFRPMRSPKWPKSAAPTGRARNPTKYVENDSIVAMNGSEPGKNFCGNTVAAATPYRKKSYHSMVVPTEDETTARRRFLRTTSSEAVSVTRESLCRDTNLLVRAVGRQDDQVHTAYCAWMTRAGCRRETSGCFRPHPRRRRDNCRP